MKKLLLTEEDKQHGRSLLLGAFQQDHLSSEYIPIVRFYAWAHENTYLNVSGLRAVISKCLLAGDAHRAIRVYDAIVADYNPVGSVLWTVWEVGVFAGKMAFVAVVFYLLFIAIKAHAQPPAHLWQWTVHEQDTSACLASIGNLVAPNPYLYTDFKQVWLEMPGGGFHEPIARLKSEINDARDTLDTYLDETPMREISVDTVRSMLSSITASIVRLRCLDKQEGVAIEKQIAMWVKAVELELKVEESRRACVVYCSSPITVPPMSKDDCEEWCT